MGSPCRVCAHLQRAEIDAKAARHQCNVAALAREYGVSRDSMTRHRNEHLSTFLKMYGASATLPTLGELHAEYVRLHSAALDSLALAEAGTLLAVDEQGNQHRHVSPTHIARAVGEARKVLDSITRLAADASAEDERPTGIADNELNERMRRALSTVMDRSLNSSIGQDAITESEEIDISEIASGGPPQDDLSLSETRIVEYPALARPQISLDAAMPSQTPQATAATAVTGEIAPPPTHLAPGLTENARRVLTESSRTIENPRHEDSPLLTVPNPRYPGSPGASAEERRAAGYPDLVITLEDLKSNRELVAEIIAQHRLNNSQEQAAPGIPLT